MSGFEVVYADQPNPTAYRAAIHILARIAREILEERRSKQLGEPESLAYSQITAEPESVKKLELPQ